ncbi:MAG: hypothetical protein ACFFD4_22045, partial [Candidatus Odinarchaeota archaeon]
PLPITFSADQLITRKKFQHGIPCPMLRAIEGADRLCLMDLELNELTLVNIVEYNQSLIEFLMGGKHKNHCLNMLLEKDGFCFCPTKLIKIELFGEPLDFQEYLGHISLAKQVGILGEHDPDCSHCLHKMILQVKKSL